MPHISAADKAAAAAAAEPLDTDDDDQPWMDPGGEMQIGGVSGGDVSRC